MSIDVLAYNSLSAEIKPLRNAVNALQCCIDTTNASISAVQGSITTQLACCACVEAQVAANATSLVANAGPNQAHLWCLIPTGSSWTGGVLVCDTSGNFRCGATCTWTVPGGVTCARFQIWGAGGGSGAAGCCGGSVFGSTGAYASVIIPVSAGQVYTLCAGCAAQCYPTRLSGTGRFPGCPSFVLGTGLSNFCANGGQGRMGTWMQMYGRRNPRRLANVTWNYGWCLCGQGTNFCAAVSNSRSGGEIPYVAGASYFGSTTNNSLVYGIRGMWNRACWEPFQGYFVHPPIYGFESTSQCCFTWTATCCGRTCSACCGFLAIPGAGGVPSTSTFQNYGACGDMGKGGMVCVCFR